MHRWSSWDSELPAGPGGHGSVVEIEGTCPGLHHRSRQSDGHPTELVGPHNSALPLVTMLASNSSARTSHGLTSRGAPRLPRHLFARRRPSGSVILSLDVQPHALESLAASGGSLSLLRVVS